MSRSANEEMILFCQMLRLAVDSDIPLPTGLREFARRHEDAQIRSWGSMLADRLQEGHSLADAVGGLAGVDPLLAVLVSVPEGKGLSVVLASYGRYLMLSGVIRERLRSALFYPLLLMGMVWVNFALINVHLFPSLEIVYAMKNLELPWIVQALYVANRQTWPTSFLGTAVFVFAPLAFFLLTIREELPKGRGNPLTWILGLNAFHQAELRSRVFEAVAMSLEGGRTLPDSLRVASVHWSMPGSPEMLGRTAEAIEQGNDPAHAMAGIPFFAGVVGFFRATTDQSQWIGVFRSAAAQELEAARAIPQTIELVSGILALLLSGVLVLICGMAFFGPYFGVIGAPW